MSILLDENLSHSHITLLTGLGYSAKRVYDVGLSGESDEVIWDYIQKHNLFLVTLDTDFSDIRKFFPLLENGLLIIRPKDKSIEVVSDILGRVFSEYTLDELRGCLVVADKTKTRIRKSSP